MQDKIEFVQQMQKRTIPKTEEARIIGRQYLRSATSMAANYRAVCRARSQAEFFAKFSIVVEETDESLFWLEIMIEAEIPPESKLAGLITEATELLAIFATARKNTSIQKKR